MSTAVVASLMMLVIIPDITFLRGGSLVAKLFRSFAGNSGNINLLLLLTNTRPGRVAEETCLAGGRGFTSLLGLPCKLQKNTESSLGEPGILFTEGGDPRREGLVFGGAPSNTLLGGKVLLLSVEGRIPGFREAGLGRGGGGSTGGGVGTGAVIEGGGW